MTIFMLSLADMPPLVGIRGKLYVFAAAVQGGWSWLAAVVGIILVGLWSSPVVGLTQYAFLTWGVVG